MNNITNLVSKPLSKKILLSLASFIFFLFIILVLLEIYFRNTTAFIITPSNEIQSDRRGIIMNTVKGKRLHANLNITVKNEVLSRKDIIIKTNSLGLRSDEIAPQKPLDEIRILVLGDSITFQGYAQESETYVKMIENHFSRTNPDKKIKTINAGVDDIGIQEEIDILEEIHEKIKPDIVLLQFYLNDSRPSWGFPKELGYPGWLRKNSLLVDKIYQYLKLKKFIKEKGLDRLDWWIYEKSDWNTNQLKFQEFISAAKLDWGSAWQPDSWQTVKQQFDRLKNLSQKGKFTVSVIFFPNRFQVYSKFNEDYPQNTMKNITAEYGFGYLDILPLLRKDQSAEYFYDWCHPQPAANYIIAEYISGFLLENYLKTK